MPQTRWPTGTPKVSPAFGPQNVISELYIRERSWPKIQAKVGLYLHPNVLSLRPGLGPFMNTAPGDTKREVRELENWKKGLKLCQKFRKAKKKTKTWSVFIKFISRLQRRNSTTVSCFGLFPVVYSKFVVADIADLGASPGTGGSRGIRVAVSEPGVVSDGDAAAAHGCDFPTCQIRTDVSARGPGPGADFHKET